MKAGMKQTEDDVDELEAQLEALEVGTDVRLTWSSVRSSDPVSIDATALPHDGRLAAFFRTDERKSDFATYRRGRREISVTAMSRTTNRNETVGWLLEVEVLDDQGGDS